MEMVSERVALVAEIVLRDPRFVSILGNNEQALIERNPASFRPEELAHQNWTLEQIGGSMSADLRTLSRTRIERIGGKSVLLVHSADDSHGCTGVDAITCGHTHKQSRWTHNGIDHINPGSLGASFKRATADFAILEIANDTLQVDFVSIAFDDSELARDYARRSVPDAPYLLDMLKLTGEDL